MADLTDQEFIRFLEAKLNGPFKCTVCGHGELAVNVAVGTAAVEAAPNAPFPASLSHVQDDNSEGVHAYYSFVCTNCGHAYFFHTNQVSHWQQEQEKPPSDQDDG